MSLGNYVRSDIKKILRHGVKRTCEKAEDYQLVQTATDSTCNVENDEEERGGMI
jgi:hypothetical protein